LLSVGSVLVGLQWMRATALLWYTPKAPPGHRLVLPREIRGQTAARAALEQRPAEIRKAVMCRIEWGRVRSDGAQGHGVEVANVRRGFAVGSRPDGES